MTEDEAHPIEGDAMPQRLSRRGVAQKVRALGWGFDACAPNSVLDHGGNTVARNKWLHTGAGRRPRPEAAVAALGNVLCP
jgi:hypothetical protein